MLKAPLSPTASPRALHALSDDARYRLLVEAVTDYAIYMLDPQGMVVSWNPGAQRLKGYSAKEALGLHFGAFYTPQDRQAGRPESALAQAAAEGRFEAEGWRVRQDASRFWALVVIDPIRAEDGSLLGFAKVTRDLTERRAADEAIRRSEQQFRLLVEGVTDYAIYMLDAGGTIVSWNSGAERIKGYQAAEVIGTHFSRFYREADIARGAPAAALAAAMREGRFEAESVRVRKGGEEFHAHVVIDSIQDSEGRIVGYAKVTRDVTEKKRAQQELEQAREALFQAQKLEAIGRLTGGVAHDFNNLLMVIMSSLELTKRRLPDDAKLMQLINNALDGVRRGATLTQRLLAFARRQDLRPTTVHLPTVVSSLVDMLSRTLGKSVRLHTAFAPTMRPVRIDVNQLELALLNLVVNARDAMPQGGNLRIEVSEEEIVAASAGMPAPGAYLRLSVSDDGAGMDAATLARAAEPFFTTKGTGKGTGLGLSMVHGLAEQSGGRLVLDSQLGTGTTATLWLPATDDQVAGPADALAEEATKERPRPSLLVLAVDDDPLVLTNTGAMLEELGHSVLLAASAAEALQILRRGHGVGLLITDHAMPQMTGAQLIATAAEEFPALPVVVASGYAELPEDLPSFVVRLAKPFEQHSLAQSVEAALQARARPGGDG